jgi:hypothetical protein
VADSNSIRAVVRAQLSSNMHTYICTCTHTLLTAYCDDIGSSSSG